MKEINIELRDWDYTCGDGCCYEYGTRIFLNDEEVEHPNEEVTNNGYVGSNVATTLEAVLKVLGYKVIVNHTSEMC